MNELPDFDLNKGPLPPDKIAQLREDLTRLVERVDRREAWHRRASWSVPIVAAVGAGAYSLFWGASHGGIGLGQIVAGSALAAQTLLAWVVVLAFLLAFEGSLIDKARQAEQWLAEELKDLDAENYPDECIQFSEWCTLHEDIRLYQNQLAVMGRKPLRGEYLAVKTWVNATQARRLESEKRELARAACARLSEPVRA